MTLIETYSKAERAAREAVRMECRASRHLMERLPAPTDWQMPSSHLWMGAKYILHKRCSRCGTWRHIAINHRGGLLATYYDYPDGYLQEPGEGRMSSDDLRLWEVEQVEQMEAPRRVRLKVAT